MSAVDGFARAERTRRYCYLKGQVSVCVCLCVDLAIKYVKHGVFFTVLVKKIRAGIHLRFCVFLMICAFAEIAQTFAGCFTWRGLDRWIEIRWCYEDQWLRFAIEFTWFDASYECEKWFAWPMNDFLNKNSLEISFNLLRYMPSFSFIII